MLLMTSGLIFHIEEMIEKNNQLKLIFSFHRFSHMLQSHPFEYN